MKYGGDTDAETANYFSFVLMELLTWQGFVDSYPSTPIDDRRPLTTNTG
jgi:hypothetical protein